MIDGLALGETTPGSLIMVAAFVGFVGGVVKEVLGPQALFAGGALTATVVVWFTFLLSFIFTFAGRARIAPALGHVTECRAGTVGPFSSPGCYSKYSYK